MADILGTITLMGSGEMAESMRKVHKAILSRISGRVRAVFLDTPAGFQLNVDEISARAVEYFQHRLDTPLAVASYKSKQISALEAEQALIKLHEANYIFAGPGSPTYFINQLRGSSVLETLCKRFAAGAHLVFASAAAITTGRFSLPVYEIYKVGEKPYWVEGFNFLEDLGVDVAVIPHWNNAEGGTHDTRFCYLGEPRLKRLEHDLPDSSVILGIDEHTACIIEPTLRQCHVQGVGQVVVRYGEREHVHPSGTSFKLDELHPGTFDREAGVISPDRPPSESIQDWDAETQLDEQIRLTGGLLADPATRTWGVSSILSFLLELARKVDAAKETGIDGEKIAAAEAMLIQMMIHWSGYESASNEVNELIDLLVAVRTDLRAAKRWELADQIRQNLAKKGIILEDGRENTTWSRAKH
ncbi:MAG: hypothetical protein JRI22_09695 [Deltaproteobacteria bacterium]|nr:hypothetical protein [Deltaproteobacteria bacterium]